jgi:hypothetical protein
MPRTSAVSPMLCGLACSTCALSGSMYAAHSMQKRCGPEVVACECLSSRQAALMFRHADSVTGCVPVCAAACRAVCYGEIGGPC